MINLWQNAQQTVSEAKRISEKFMTEHSANSEARSINETRLTSRSVMQKCWRCWIRFMSPVRQSPDPLPLTGFSSGLWSQCLVLHMMKQMSVDSVSSPSHKIRNRGSVCPFNIMKNKKTESSASTLCNQISRFPQGTSYKNDIKCL